jgi:hypothetical protein
MYVATLLQIKPPPGTKLPPIDPPPQPLGTQDGALPEKRPKLATLRGLGRILGPVA